MELTPLSYFDNIHTGKIGFVCGSGTSLSDIPKNIGDKGIVICINSAGKHFDKVDYLYLTDSAIPHMEYWEEVVAKSDNIVLANPQLEGIVYSVKEKYPDKNCFLMTRNYEDHHDYNFGNDILCLGNDAALSCANLAYIMDFKHVVLCGIDLCYQNGNRYFTPDAYTHKTDSPYKESFEKDYIRGKQSDGGYETDLWLIPSISNWQKVWTQNQVRNISEKILNASPISMIAHFRKIDIEEFLKTC